MQDGQTLQSGRRNKTEQLEAYKDEITALAFELSAQDARHKALTVSGRPLRTVLLVWSQSQLGARPFQGGAILLLGLCGKYEMVASGAQATLVPGGRHGSSEADGNAHPATAALLQAAMSKLTLSNDSPSFGELAPFDRDPEQSQRLQVLSSLFVGSTGLSVHSAILHGRPLVHSKMSGCECGVMHSSTKSQQFVPPLAASICTQMSPCATCLKPKQWRAVTT